MLKFDNDNLKQVSDALQIIHPGRNLTPDRIRAHIAANISESAGSYVGTEGWIAFTWYNPHTEEIRVRVAIEPYAVLWHEMHERGR